jgi:hypothetical protein
VTSKSPNFACKLIYSFEKHDLAILECCDDQTHDFLPIAPRNAELPPNTIVDIFGYPGDMKEKLLRREHYITALKDLDASQKEATTLLVPNTLMISRGTIQPHDEHLMKSEISYSITTCPGMSGGCIVYNNMVYGTSLHTLFSLH